MKIFTYILMLSLPFIAFSQVGNPDSVPIDGGASILLAAGAAYGVKKIRDNRKKKD